MTFRQWLAHVRQWFFAVTQFPLPRHDTHMWVGIAGEREQTCLICQAAGEDRDVSDEELLRDKMMAERYDAVAEEFFGEDQDV